MRFPRLEWAIAQPLPLWLLIIAATLSYGAVSLTVTTLLFLASLVFARDPYA